MNKKILTLSLLCCTVVFVLAQDDQVQPVTTLEKVDNEFSVVSADQGTPYTRDKRTLLLKKKLLGLGAIGLGVGLGVGALKG